MGEASEADGDRSHCLYDFGAGLGRGLLRRGGMREPEQRCAGQRERAAAPANSFKCLAKLYAHGDQPLI